MNPRDGLERLEEQREQREALGEALLGYIDDARAPYVYEVDAGEAPHESEPSPAITMATLLARREEVVLIRRPPAGGRHHYGDATGEERGGDRR